MSKGFLDKLKDMFVEDDSKPAGSKSSAPETPAASAAPTSTSIDASASASQTVGSDTPVLNVAGLTQRLDDLIKGAPGYAEFAKFDATLESLATVIADEGTRFKAAQATLKANASTLVTSLKTSTEVLAQETQNFEGSFVASAQAAIADLQQKSTEVTASIAETTKRLAELSDLRTQVGTQIIQKTSDLGRARIDFAAVTSTLTSHYSDLMAKVEQHLGAVQDGK
jgi:chromosome segregation ATPase